MRFETKIAILLILFYGLQLNSYGQTITFNILKKMVASREYKDSIVNSFSFRMVNHIPAVFGTESQDYISRDSSKTIEFFYRDSASSCVFWTKDLNLLQNIISAGRIDGFSKVTVVSPNPKTTAYVKGKYLLLFNDANNYKRTGNVSLVKSYQAFNIAIKSN
jgi:hypothetical protein